MLQFIIWILVQKFSHKLRNAQRRTWNICENKKTESDITEFKNYIVYLNGDMKTYCDESGCYTEIVLQTYKAFNR